MVISLLCPSRGRPENLRRLSESAFSLAASPLDIEVLAYVDLDDPALPQYVALDCAEIHTGERIMFTDYWNKLAEVAHGNIMGMMGDDVVFRTPGWDRMVEAAFGSVPDRMVLVYGRDGFRNQVHASHPFLSREWCEVLGYLYPHPEVFTQDMVDVWVFELAQAVNRTIYLPELFTQHMHPDDPSLGVEFDQTYRDNAMRRERDRTHERYADYAAERAADVEKLRRALR